jgi:hypothetical protein
MRHGKEQVSGLETVDQFSSMQLNPRLVRIYQGEEAWTMGSGEWNVSSGFCRVG